MENIRAKIKDGMLIIKVDLSKKGELSQTGRSRIIAKTNRFEAVEDYGLTMVVTKKVEKKKKKKAKDEEDD